MSERLSSSDPDSSVHQHGKNRRRHNAAGLVADLAAGTAIGSALLAGGIYVEGGTPLLEGTFANAKDSVDPIYCPPVTQTERQAIERTVDHASPTSIPSGGEQFTIASWRSFQERYYRYAEAEATVTGMTLVDDQSYIEQLEQPQSVETTLSILNSYASQYGFDVVIDRQNTGDSHGVLPSAIDADKFRAGAINLIQGIHYIPRQVFEVAHLKTLHIDGSLNDVNNPVIGHAEVEGETLYQTGDMYLPLSTVYDRQFSIFDHELGHRLDYETCHGDMKSDPTYAALNPSGFKYGEKSPAADDFVDPYGETNILEDKATHYQFMLNGINPYMAIDQAGTSDDKYRLLLGRLDEQIPGIAKYLSALGGNDVIHKYNPNVEYLMPPGIQVINPYETAVVLKMDDIS